MSIDHRIQEIEEQRNFFGSRCAKMADRIGELEALASEKDATIARLMDQLVAAQQPKRPRKKA